MLAQNFKSADSLNLTEDEFNAMVTVLGMFEREEVQYRSAERADTCRGIPDTFEPRSFNMRFFAGADDCGTVACICGWAEYVGRLPAGSLMEKRLSFPYLDRLFDPTGYFNYDQITIANAAAALRNYLTFGEPRWDEVMAP